MKPPSNTKAWVRALDYSRAASHRVLPEILERWAATHGSDPALLSQDSQLNFAELIARSNQYARWALTRFEPRETVCLLMANSPEYVAIWLGLTRVGCTVALLNTNLRTDALQHCIEAAHAKSVITTSDLRPKELRARVLVLPLSDIDLYSRTPLVDPLPRPGDTALLIYTSGTTGLPKAVKITHRRIVEWSFWFAGLMDTQRTDRLYNCLPMYHSIGGVVAIGSMLVRGGSVFIRERFSTQQFWLDVVLNDCTVFQYIGELCRYLTRSPLQPGPHKLRLACGNGLNAEVWTTFQDRFKIPQILEYYAATEGHVSLYNLEGRPGSIGRYPPWLAERFPVSIIQCDPESGDPIRNEAGFCVPCATDEVGETIGEMRGSRSFDGYTDSAASRKKLLSNVFKSGDQWFRTGDLMRKDAAGYYYFVDRLGDTFRWKGENVSATEVANVIRQCSGVIDALVYGVAIPGEEGRAGMAAISVNERFALGDLYDHLAATLPSYARPLFIRLCDALETTGTFKLSKARLVREGYTDTSEPVWTVDRTKERYVPL